MEERTKVIEFVRRNGPVLPVQISKQISSNIILASAILSELVSKKDLLVSNAKIGSSPVYYLPGQEYRLEGMLVDYLKGKEKEAFNLLKEKKVIRDVAAEPWQRVALRAIKDFAKQLNVKTADNTEIFWKFYSIDDAEVKEKIGELFKLPVKEKVPEPVEEKIFKQPIIEKLKSFEPKVPEKLKQKTLEKQVILEKPKVGSYSKMRNYLEKNGIKIVNEKAIRKQKECDLIVEVPSHIGALLYYVKYKDKKTISNADLSLASAEGQQKKLPVIFLSTGKLSKKTEDYVESKLKGQIVFRSID